MTTSRTTTPSKSGKLYFLNPQSVAFQAVLDLFESAMRADSALHQSGASILSQIGFELGNTAAKAWADCDTAVKTLLMMPDLHKCSRIAAEFLMLLLPEHIEDDLNFQGYFSKLSKASKTLRKRDQLLADQMMDAALIFHVFEANAKLAKLQRVHVAA